MLKETLPDGSIVTVSTLRTEHRTADGVLLASRPPTSDELAALAAVPDAWADVIAADRAAEVALDVTRGQVRAASARLVEIAAQAGALAQAAALPTATQGQVVTAVQTLDARQRQIGAAIGDLATIVRAIGRVVLRDVA